MTSCNKSVRRRSVLSGGIASALGCMASGRARGTTNLRLQGIWTNDPESIGYFIGIDNGAYNKAGIPLTYLPGGPDLLPEGSLLSGRADVALLSMINAAQAIYVRRAPFRIIGAQYQINPDAVITMASSNIRSPQDLHNKTIACPPLSLLTFRAMLTTAGLSPNDVKIVPYTFDPKPLIDGSVDAIVDYMTLLPWVIEKVSGKRASYFKFYDVGMPLYSNVVVVTEENLTKRRTELEAFLSVSQSSWEINFENTTTYPNHFQSSWFSSSGLSLDAMIAQNRAQQALMTSPSGLFSMTPTSITQNIKTLSNLDIHIGTDIFEPTLLTSVN